MPDSSIGLDYAWRTAANEAARTRHEFIEPEHLFIGVCKLGNLLSLNDWNDIVIIAWGNHIQHFLNGAEIVDFTDNDPQLALKEGLIGLQLHAGKPMWAEFKEIRIKDLAK